MLIKACTYTLVSIQKRMLLFKIKMHRLKGRLEFSSSLEKQIMISNYV